MEDDIVFVEDDARQPKQKRKIVTPKKKKERTINIDISEAPKQQQKKKITKKDEKTTPATVTTKRKITEPKTTTKRKASESKTTTTKKRKIVEPKVTTATTTKRRGKLLGKNAVTGKKKRTKKAGEDKSLKDDEIRWSEPAEQICNHDYRVFGPNGIPLKADVVGFDIGTRHLAMTGISDHPDDPNIPMVVCAALADATDKSAHHACDNIDQMLVKREEFDWVTKSDHHGVEQQLQVNPKARIVAGAIRSCIRTSKMLRDEPIDVSYVPASYKYNLVQLFTKDERYYGPDPSELKGAGNTQKRKLLGELHARGIWRATGDHTFSQWFKQASKWTDQKHDISDSYLIALRKWLELKGRAPAVKKAKKTTTEDE